MKTRLIISIIAIVLPSISMLGQGGLRPRGDVNCDWEVNIADINALVDSIFSGAKYNALYTYAVLAAEALRLLDDFLRSVLIERYLSDPRFVTDIYKDQSAEASGLGHPSIEHYVLSFVGKS